MKGKRSLLCVLLVGTLSILIATVGVVGATAHWFATSVVTDLSGKLLEETQGRIAERVERLLQVAVRPSEIAARIAPQDVAGPDFERIVERFADLADAYPELAFISLTFDATGNYAHVYRDPDGHLEFQRALFDPKSGAIRREDYTLGRSGRRLLRQRSLPHYDTRQRPYYKAARAAGRRVWTDTYPFNMPQGPDAPGVTCATPLRGPDGRLRAVLTADFTLESLSAYLRTLKLGRTGYACLVERRSNGALRIIAHPRPHLLGEPRAGDLALSALLGGFQLDGSEGLRRVQGRGGTYLASCHVLTGSDHPRWLLCALVPEDETLEGVHRSAVIGEAVAAVGIVLGIGFCLLLSRWVTRPLQVLTQEADRIRRLLLEARSEPAPPTPVREVDKLGQAITQLREGLAPLVNMAPRPYREALERDGVSPTPGGARQVITVGFLHLSRFSALTRDLPAQEQVELLSEALEALSEAIEGSGGLVDKYLGNEVMGLWEGPSQAEAACRAAWACSEVWDRLGARWRERGIAAPHLRLGFASGEALLGNLGSERRYQFSALGTPVGAARRVESMNLRWGTRILLTDPTVAAAGEAIVVRPLERAVLGEGDPAMVWELLGLAETADDATRRLAALGRRAAEQFRARRWSDAETTVRESLALRPGDPAMVRLLGLCHDLERDPPGPDWDPVWQPRTL